MIRKTSIFLIFLLSCSAITKSNDKACCPPIGETKAGKIVKAASIGDLAKVKEMTRHNLDLLNQAIILASTHTDSSVALILQGVKEMYEDQEKTEERARENGNKRWKNKRLLKSYKVVTTFLSVAFISSLLGNLWLYYTKQPISTAHSYW